MSVNFLTKSITEALIQWEEAFKATNQNYQQSNYYFDICKKFSELCGADLTIVYCLNKLNNSFELSTNRPDVSNVDQLVGWLEKILVEHPSPANPLSSTFLLVLRHFDLLTKNNFGFCFSHTTGPERISLFAAGISAEMAQWLNQNEPLYRYLLHHYLGLRFQNKPWIDSYVKISVNQKLIRILEHSNLPATIQNQLSELVENLENRRGLLLDSNKIEILNSLWMVRQIATSSNEWYLLYIGETQEKHREAPLTNQILEQLPQGLLVLNDRGYIEYVNSTTANILDASPTQLIGRHIGRFLANSDYQKIIFEQFREQKGKIDNFLIQVLTNTNQLRSVTIFSRRLPDNKTLILLQEDQKQISYQQELQRKENEFNRIAQNPKILFAKISNSGEILESNVQLAKLLSYTLDGLIGKNIRHFLVNSETTTTQIIWEKILSGEITQCSLKLQAPNSKAFVWLTTIQQVGEQLWFVGINATEFHEMELAFMTKEKLLQTILENLPIGVMVVKRNYQVVFSNLVGINPDQSQVYCHNLLFNTGEICPGCQLHSTFENNDIRKNYIDNETTQKTYQIIDIPLEKEDGSVEYVIEFLIDLSEQIQTQRQLKKAHEAAEKASKLKTAFLHNITHEIRSPLNAIMGFSKLLSIRSDENDAQRTMLEVIYNNGEALLKTINNLIDLSQLQCGDYILSSELFNLNKLLETLAANLANNPKITSGNIMLNMVQPNFHIWLRTDKNRITQIVEQLLENAIRFTDQGSVSLILDLTTDEVWVSVTDNSPVYEGSPEALFEYFGRDNLTKHPWHGAGIGLALAYQNAKALGGTLNYNPDYTKGCRFDLRLPKSIAETKEITKLPMLSWNNKIILIAEDDFSSYLYLNDLLSSTGIEILHATNGRDVLQMLSPEIDLILLDIHLPILDGLQVAQQIRRMDYKLPIVALTANPYSERQCLEAGCNYFITKPVSSSTLLPILQHYLG